jgi:hypothetical protein
VIRPAPFLCISRAILRPITPPPIISTSEFIRRYRVYGRNAERNGKGEGAEGRGGEGEKGRTGRGDTDTETRGRGS